MISCDFKFGEIPGKIVKIGKKANTLRNCLVEDMQIWTNCTVLLSGLSPAFIVHNENVTVD